jgi:hypothetical protein
MVSPGNEQREVILPVQSALKKVGSRTVRWSIDKGDARLRLCVVYLDSLKYAINVSGTVDRVRRSKNPQGRLPMQ